MALDYRLDHTYADFVHRELSLNWLQVALLMGGHHRVHWQFDQFSLLEFGCGQGLNLLLHAAAHPQARFYGVDLHPDHVQLAERRAVELGLSNVQFICDDLVNFVAGAPRSNAARSWPDQHDVVVAQGVASWVSLSTRVALFQAASAGLKPGGVFYCSYNTYPGWLSRSPLQQLSLEIGLLDGDNTTLASLRQAQHWLQDLLDSPQSSPPLGRALPDLSRHLHGLDSAPAPYLLGEFHRSHQPQYVGTMLRECEAAGLSLVGTATLPELFPQLLDSHRLQLLQAAPTLPLRETLLDLLIHQSFRRDLYAKGVVPLDPDDRLAALGTMPVHLRRAPEQPSPTIDCSLGVMGLDPQLLGSIQRCLQAEVCCLEALARQVSIALGDLLPIISLLLHTDQIGLAAWPAGAASHQAALRFNRDQCAAIGTPSWLGCLLVPDLLQPLPVSGLQLLVAQADRLDLSDRQTDELVWCGAQMAGLAITDEQGDVLDDAVAALSQVQKIRLQAAQSGLLHEINRFDLLALG